MPQVVLLPECQTVFTDPQFPGNLRLGLATMNHQLHCLALKLLIVSLLYLLFFHGLSHFTLSFRVRQIRGGSDGKKSLDSWVAKTQRRGTLALNVGRLLQLLEALLTNATVVG